MITTPMRRLFFRRVSAARFAPALLVAFVAVACRTESGTSAAPPGPVFNTAGLSLLPAPPRRALVPPVLPNVPVGMRVSAANTNVQRVFMKMKALPQPAQSPEEVMDRAIVPVLAAVQFAPGRAGFSMPPRGVVQRPATLSGALELMEQEFTGDPQRLRRTTLPMLDLLRGRQAPRLDLDRDLQLITGRTLDQTRLEFERPDVEYVYRQMVGDVPIEHVALTASRRDGQSVSTVRGAVIHRHSITNQRPAAGADAFEMGQRALKKHTGVAGQARQRGSEPVLVLFPYGNDAQDGVALRYAWRMALRAPLEGREQSFLVWVDAETGDSLKIESLTSEIVAKGSSWQRDPGSGSGTVRTFEVDPAVPSGYRLQLASVAQRVDYLGDKDTDNDLEISSTDKGSDAGLANFDQSPINAHATAVCAHQENTEFQQVNLFALLVQNRDIALNNGLNDFPPEPWAPALGLSLCNSWSTMSFGSCQGYREKACPNWVSPTNSSSKDNYINFAHDASIVAHEVGHAAVAHLGVDRPKDWCPSPPCPVPVGFAAVHDLADAWADHVVNTNCVGGWVAKNIGGVDASKDCATHREDHTLPRRHELPGDRFPERRHEGHTLEVDYVNMQIAAAVLWELREGMRSKEGALGETQYFKRLIGAIRGTGLSGATVSSNDLGIYDLFQELELELTEQWANTSVDDGGNFTTNEVAAAFARAGLFMVPPECLDDDPTTTHSSGCSQSDNGADAVIDVDDNDPMDGPLVDGVRRADSDYLKRGGPPPVFHVWTGPRFRFVGGKATFPASAPCNTAFMVEVSIDPGFPTERTQRSEWTDVPVTSTLAAKAECHGTWSPTSAQWAQLQNDASVGRLYYRATTRDATQGNLRLSTQPLAGLWAVNPPFAVLTPDGIGPM